MGLHTDGVDDVREPDENDDTSADVEGWEPEDGHERRVPEKALASSTTA